MFRFFTSRSIQVYVHADYRTFVQSGIPPVCTRKDTTSGPCKYMSMPITETCSE